MNVLRSDLASLGPRFARRRRKLETTVTPLNWPTMARDPGYTVSDNPRHLIFRPPTLFFRFFFGRTKKFRRVFGQDFEELAFFERHEQIADSFLL